MDTDTEAEAITINGWTVTLAAPADQVIRHEILHLYSDNPHRAFAAALGVCWRKIQLNLKYNHQPMKYGHAVTSLLLEQGARYHEIVVAGSHAFNALADGLIGGAEVSEAVDFSEAPKEDG